MARYDIKIFRRNPSESFEGIEDEAYKMPTDFEIKSIVVKRKVNKIPLLEIVFIDAESKVSTAYNNVPAIEAALKGFGIGQQVYLHIQQGEAKLEFKGLVIKQSVRRDEEGQFYTVVIKHPAYVYSANIRSAVHQADQGDTKCSYHQSFCSDWDFLITMADLHCRWVVTNDYDVKFFKDKDNDDGASYTTFFDNNKNIQVKELNITYETGVLVHGPSINKQLKVDLSGKNKILSIDCNNNVDGVYPDVTYKNPLVESNDITNSELPNSLSDKLKAIGRDKLTYFNPDTITDSAEKMVSAKAWRAKYSFSRGTIRYINEDLTDSGKYDEGNNALCLGKKITGIQTALGYNKDDKTIIANTRITSICHKINQEGWFVDIGWGMDPKFHIEQHPDVQSPPAFGLTPGVNGIHHGIVYKNSVVDDSEVEVKMFNTIFLKFRKIGHSKVADNNNGVNYQDYKPGDVVTVAFVNDDPNSGVVLGMISYNAAEAAAIAAAKEAAEAAATAEERIAVVAEETGEAGVAVDSINLEINRE